MDTLTFIAELVKATAWPVAAIVIVTIFRRQLGALLTRIRRGKVGLAEFEFEREVEVLTEQAPPQLQNVAIAAISLATTNPRAAILESWLEIEQSVDQLARNTQLPNFSPPRNSASTIRAMAKSGILPLEDVALFNELRALRNQAVHAPEFSPSPESVIKYVQLAQGLKQRIDGFTYGR